MYDCNLIKTRAQKMQDYLLPSLESTYQKMQMPSVPLRPLPVTPTPTQPLPSGPMAPAAPAFPPTSPVTPPAAPFLPPAPPEAEQVFPINPLLPRILPTSPNLTVPKNPLLPEAYSTILDYESLQYLNGYLRTQIGEYVEVQLLVGSTNLISIVGRLVGVGLNYILLEDLATADITACDFYNIKFFKTHAHSDVAPSR